MSRKLDTATLDLAAEQWAGQFAQPTQYSVTSPEVAVSGRFWVIQSLFNADFKDEFEYILPRIKAHLGKAALATFEEFASKQFTPRDDAVLAEKLAEKLAITPDGDHIPGRVGKVIVGTRDVGTRINRNRKIKDARWPIYAGEDEERAAGSDAVDPLPAADSMFVGEAHLAAVAK